MSRLKILGREWLQRDMCMTLFCAGAPACLAADAIFRIGNGHHFIAHVITEFILALKGFFYKLQHFPAADLVTAPAANAFFNVDRFNELRRPCLAAPCVSDNCHDSSLLRHQVKIEVKVKQ
jgi:hypothetical protein